MVCPQNQPLPLPAYKDEPIVEGALLDLADFLAPPTLPAAESLSEDQDLICFEEANPASPQKNLRSSEPEDVLVSSDSESEDEVFFGPCTVQEKLACELVEVPPTPNMAIRGAFTPRPSRPSSVCPSTTKHQRLLRVHQDHDGQMPICAIASLSIAETHPKAQHVSAEEDGKATVARGDTKKASGNGEASDEEEDDDDEEDDEIFFGSITDREVIKGMAVVRHELQSGWNEEREASQEDAAPVAADHDDSPSEESVAPPKSHIPAPSSRLPRAPGPSRASGLAQPTRRPARSRTAMQHGVAPAIDVINVEKAAAESADVLARLRAQTLRSVVPAVPSLGLAPIVHTPPRDGSASNSTPHQGHMRNAADTSPARAEAEASAETQAVQTVSQNRAQRQPQSSKLQKPGTALPCSRQPTRQSSLRKPSTHSSRGQAPTKSGLPATKRFGLQEVTNQGRSTTTTKSKSSRAGSGAISATAPGVRTKCQPSLTDFPSPVLGAKPKSWKICHSPGASKDAKSTTARKPGKWSPVKKARTFDEIQQLYF
ncbi:uncharacterized protein MONBRDRAFT_25445 [Monosiga brevicollis MX1]|uniref:Uncharacterized protein n=1 Tax=Monosiga brevicollis TaxID=81824 RepID=A9UZG0_MONBE|nr:uncharacterized protein MONBRDRAFT_25445 [Monosiga brevicollis MX1]EDQ89225.1 predicted protein [Monosiga brevicollis MX1]|eukprot:XP_001745801.1 hypothetical protein [Monosiga brevicollis MX1]